MCPLSASPPECALFCKCTSDKRTVWKACFPKQTFCQMYKRRSRVTEKASLSRCTYILTTRQQSNPYFFFLRKEVIQPHLPIRLPCYDFTPVIRPAFDGSFLAVRSPASGISDSHGVTGGVYKTRERIHRGILIRDY